jgi:hypothetical protein
MSVRDGCQKLEQILGNPQSFAMNDVFQALFECSLLLPFHDDDALALIGPADSPVLFGYTSDAKKREGLEMDPLAFVALQAKVWKPGKVAPLITVLARSGGSIAVNAGTTPNILVNQEMLRHMAKCIEAGST